MCIPSWVAKGQEDQPRVSDRRRVAGIGLIDRIAAGQWDRSDVRHGRLIPPRIPRINEKAFINFCA